MAIDSGILLRFGARNPTPPSPPGPTPSPPSPSPPSPSPPTPSPPSPSPPPGGSVIDTLSLINTSGSTQATNFVTEIFGLCFKKGDIPTGFYPNLELTNGTTVPVTIWDIARWSDSSMKRCSCVARVPSSISGSGTLTVNIKNNGAAPASSSRTTSDINASASRDFKVTLTGFENLTGTWSSTVNKGITDNTQVIVEANGPTCKSWRIEEEFRSGSSDHAHLLARHYVFALTDASNGVYGWYYMPAVIQPKKATASPARRAFQCTVFDGVTTLRSLDNAKTATYAGTSGRLTITAHGYSNGEAFKLTTTGALPTGLNTSTVYFAHAIDANTIEVHNDPQAIETNAHDSSIVGFTTSGSGTHTATRVAAIEHYGGFFGADSTGQCHFIAGTGARSTVRVLQQRAYLKATKLFPPYDLAITPVASASINYAPNTAGNLRRFVGNTGGHDQIAVQPAWVARHFLLQTATTEQIVRVNALVTGHIPVWIYDETTRQPPVYNNRSYTGLPAATNTIRYNGSLPGGGPGGSGIILPASAWNFYSSFDTSHNCAGPQYAYLIFGCPWFRDIQVQYCVMSSMGRGKGESNPADPFFDTNTCEGVRITISGTTYYGTGMFFGASLERVDAWTMREQLAAFLLPDAHPDGTQIVDYCKDMAKTSADAYVAWRNTRSATYRANGIYEWCVRSNGHGSPWARGYLSHTWAWGAAISEYTNAITVAQHFANYYSALQANGGIYHINSYMENFNTAVETGVDNVLDDIALHTYDGYSISTNAGTDVVTVTVVAGGPAIANGDVVTINSIRDALPGGLTGFALYYAVQVSGSTCKLSTTPGGSAVNITTSITTNAFWHHGNAGAGGSGTDGINPGDNYADGDSGVALAAIKHLMAAGMTGLSSALTEMQTIEANGGFDYVTTNPGAGPKNALTSSFT